MSKLYVITGAPGAGKSTLLRHLKDYPFATADFDELPEPDGSLMGVDITSPTASAAWPAYNRLWVKVAGMMLRSGGPVLLLCPLAPEEWAAAAEGIADPPRTAWARLDCTDAERRTRLAARGWASDEVEEAVKDAEELRASVEREFNTGGRSPAEVAAAAADWVSSGSGQRSQ
ncbi:hypothetical protein [Streptomyces sp. KL118A]|uniref:hypothetical protein n=1 Tax=Streptomyces sp. KL118A TaxID=3045153 RepID=UPI00278C2405|nr:hypothetical protein [Streptomyces sp. KL118A]